MKLWAVLPLVLVTGLVTSQALAQQTSSSGSSSASIATETTLLPSLPPLESSVTFKAGLKSTSDSGRFVEYNNPKGRSYRLWNEYYVGGMLKSGWGLTAMATTSGTTYEDPNHNAAVDFSDPSVTLEHPALLDDGTNKVWGQIRRYFPVSKYFVENKVEEWAYYLFATRKLAGQAELFNLVIGRAFLEPSYKAGNTTWVFEDITKLTKKVNSWLKYGVAHHTQVEWHSQTGTGRYIEVYPLVDFVLNKNVYIEPRLVIPVYKAEEVYDSSKNVGINGSQAELYLSMSI